ncbi:hypothetical protein GLYMA_09G187500v4 [Glycine max]|uniref:Uncharacterized protein n=1 Tax=Glycine max TaxID=3847 RepID=A0A0R0IA77_SOYBN|nr:hypothetical protein GYH30_025493 [Glycine max]KRH39239.1 hypothetical protein GLYMA_09G187500v4 [Glycine max]
MSFTKYLHALILIYKRCTYECIKVSTLYYPMILVSCLYMHILHLPVVQVAVYSTWILKELGKNASCKELYY